MRTHRGWTRSELARRLGVSQQRLGRWERGRHAPSLEELAALSEVLEVPLEELGLGRGVRRTISPREMAELLFHLGAIAKVLKPWRERQGRNKDEGGTSGAMEAPELSKRRRFP